MYKKLFESMYNGSLVTTGPWEALVTFQQMIILADKFGVVDMTPEVIARRTGIPLEIILKGIAALEEPDPTSRSAELGGRRIDRLDDHRVWGWLLVNFKHYDGLRRADERAAYQSQQYDKRKATKLTKTTTYKKDSTDSTPLNNSTLSTSHPHPHSHPHSEHEHEQKEKNYKNNSKRKSVIPPDFELTEKRKGLALNYWAKRGVTRDVEVTWDKFKAHHEGRGTMWVDWDKAWQTWYVAAIDLGRPPGGMDAQKKRDKEARRLPELKGLSI